MTVPRRENGRAHIYCLVKLLQNTNSTQKHLKMLQLASGGLQCCQKWRGAATNDLTRTTLGGAREECGVTPLGNSRIDSRISVYCACAHLYKTSSNASSCTLKLVLVQRLLSTSTFNMSFTGDGICLSTHQFRLLSLLWLTDPHRPHQPWPRCRAHFTSER